ncbi:MAG: hypothetical protein ACXWCO_13000 [Caldimonas sp.]
MATLLDKLGLPQLPGSTAPGPGPGAGAGPAGPSGPVVSLKMRSTDEPDVKLPADPKKQVDVLADAIVKVQAGVKRDKLVVLLRDAIVRIQPVMDDKDAKKKIDKAIDSLIETGSKKLLMTLIETIVGKKATEMPPEDKREHTGPAVKEKDLGEHILKSPELPLPFDKAPKVHRNSFEFRGLPKKARASSYLDFKLRTPDWFEPYGKMGAGRVVAMLADDYKKNRDGAERLSDKRIENKGEVAMTLLLPIDPGKYVIGIVVGPSLESYPIEDIELTQ